MHSIDRSMIEGRKPPSGIMLSITPTQITVMFGVLYTILATGVAAFVAGFWHVVIGKRNDSLIWVVFGLTLLLFVSSKFLPE